MKLFNGHSDLVRMGAMRDKLLAIYHPSLPRPSKKSVHLLVPPRDLGKIASESSLPELSNHVYYLGQKLREMLKK